MRNREDAGAFLRVLVYRILPGFDLEETMSRRGFRKCCYCGVWFRSRGRNAWHQRFCSKPECRAVSRQVCELTSNTLSSKLLQRTPPFL